LTEPAPLGTLAQSTGEGSMKKSYVKPTLVKAGQLSSIVAGAPSKGG